MVPTATFSSRGRRLAATALLVLAALSSSLPAPARAGHGEGMEGHNKVRKEIRELTCDEWDRYVRAVNKLFEGEDNVFVDTMVKKTFDPQMNHDHSNYNLAHSNAETEALTFLPWRRAWLRAIELELQKIDPLATIPYWNWALDAEDITGSVVLSPTYFGTTGYAKNEYCLMDGQFREMEYFEVQLEEQVPSLRAYSTVDESDPCACLAPCEIVWGSNICYVRGEAGEEEGQCKEAKPSIRRPGDHWIYCPKKDRLQILDTSAKAEFFLFDQSKELMPWQQALGPAAANQGMGGNQTAPVDGGVRKGEGEGAAPLRPRGVGGGHSHATGGDGGHAFTLKADLAASMADASEPQYNHTHEHEHEHAQAPSPSPSPAGEGEDALSPRHHDAKGQQMIGRDCIRRILPTAIPDNALPGGTLTVAAIKEILVKELDYEAFVLHMENGVGMYGHMSMMLGGDKLQSSRDPLFWSLQAFIDNLWWRWEKIHYATTQPPFYGNPNVTLDPFVDLTVEDVFSTEQLGYTYSNPLDVANKGNVSCYAERVDPVDIVALGERVWNSLPNDPEALASFPRVGPLPNPSYWAEWIKVRQTHLHPPTKDEMSCNLETWSELAACPSLPKGAWEQTRGMGLPLDYILNGTALDDGAMADGGALIERKPSIAYLDTMYSNIVSEIEKNNRTKSVIVSQWLNGDEVIQIPPEPYLCAQVLESVIGAIMEEENARTVSDTIGNYNDNDGGDGDGNDGEPEEKAEALGNLQKLMLGSMVVQTEEQREFERDVYGDAEAERRYSNRMSWIGQLFPN